MFCRNCGNQNEDGAAFCRTCGAPMNGAVPVNLIAVQSKPTSGLAVASLIFGILSLVICWTGAGGIICGILAVIMGGAGMATKKGGKGMAVAGLVCGIIALIPSIIFISFVGSVFSLF